MATMPDSPSQNSRFANRKNLFKATQDADEIRRKREDEEVQIRKKEKAEMLAQKRNKGIDASNMGGMGNTSGPDGAGLFMDPSMGGQRLGIKDDSLDEVLPQLRDAIFDNSKPEQQLEAVIVVRKLLSKEDTPPIGKVVEAGLTPKLVELMRVSEDPKLILETAWAVTNIASGEEKFTQCVVEAGGVDAFLSILESKQALRQELCEQAVWGLGNIAGDGHKLRDTLLEKGIMRILQNICSGIYSLPWLETERENNLKNVLWVMTNCCRGKPSPKFAEIKPALLVFAEVVGRKMKDTLQSEALWGIFYSVQTSGNASGVGEDSKQRLDALILAGQKDMEQVEIKANLLISCLVGIIEPRMEYETEKDPATGALRYTGHLKLGEHKDYTKDTRIPALKALGELISAEYREYTDVCVLSGIVPAVLKMLRNVDHAQARKEGCWLVSNLLAAHPDQVLAAILPYDLSPASNVNDVVDPAVTLLSSAESSADATGQAAGGAPAQAQLQIQGQKPEIKPEYMTVFDVLDEVAQQIADMVGSHPAGSAQHPPPKKMHYEITKEIIYCYTNYFSTNDLSQLEPQIIQHLNNQNLAENPLHELFNQLMRVSFPHYPPDGYTEVPAKFLHLVTHYLKMAAAKNIEPQLFSNLIDSCHKILQGDGADMKLKNFSQEIGLNDEIESLISRLHNQDGRGGNGKKLDELLHKTANFKITFFPEDLEDETDTHIGGGELGACFGQDLGGGAPGGGTQPFNF